MDLWSYATRCGDANSTTGVQFPTGARDYMILHLGKSTNQIVLSVFFLECKVGEIRTTKVNKFKINNFPC